MPTRAKLHLLWLTGIGPLSLAAALAWSVVVVGSALLDVRGHERAVVDRARAEARNIIAGDIIYRRWATGHGGVYVPVTETTPPNPHLTDIPERDITTPSGRALTLVNPAYMTRQVNELSRSSRGIRAHITSLKPIRPGNAPDAWEAQALRAFEAGRPEVGEVVEIDGVPSMRLMRPFKVEPGCLKCHARQGYAVGDVRGGLSVAVPIGTAMADANRESAFSVATHLFFWLSGVAVIGLLASVARRRRLDRERVDRERAELSAQVLQAQKMQAIGQLAGGVAHDFNNQLAAIQGYADLLLEEVRTDRQLVEHVESIHSAVAHAASLTSRLLAFARKGRYRNVTVDLHRLVDEVIGILERSIDKRIRVEKRLEADPCTTHGDPAQIENALLNLAVNARDAMPDGGVLRFSSRSITVDAASMEARGLELAPGRYVALAVTDTGSGMDEATQARLFEPFFTTKEPGKGTGLGLASVFGTVKGHEGAIRVQSSVGAGSTFEVLLPLAVPAEAGRSESGPEAPQRPASAKHILVIDDEPAVREVLVRIVERLGYRVTACGDGEEAMRVYAEQGGGIDLVLLDLMMPRMDGGEVSRRLRAIDPKVKIVLSTGYGVEGEPQRLLDAGVLGFLQKPYSLAAVSAAIAGALAREA